MPSFINLTQDVQPVTQTGAPMPSPAPVVSVGPALTPSEPAFFNDKQLPVVRMESGSAEEPSEPPAPKPEDPLVELVRCYRENRTGEVNALLQKYDPARREMLQTLLPGMAKLADRKAEPPAPREWSTLLDQCNQLGVKLCPRAALELDKVSFCRSIDGFGLYEPLRADHRFRAGAQGQAGELVQVYLELRHFASQISGPHYETVLASALEIRDAQHKVVWQCTSQARPTRSRTLRQDCFLNCHFEVPVIAPGDYILWIQVKDLTGVSGDGPPAHRIATRTLDFRVVSPAQTQVSR